VFHDDNGFRDMFIYGSMAMLAAMALPSKRAHAAEFYLCGDGRTIELTNSNRQQATAQDSCVTSWYADRQRTVSSKSGKRTSIAQASAEAAGSSVGYQIQTSGIEPLINAVEVPEGKAIIHKPIQQRETGASERNPRKDRVRRTADAGRSAKGLRNMGDGIFAQ
jgi:uncharacterized protein with GYD domain